MTDLAKTPPSLIFAGGRSELAPYSHRERDDSYKDVAARLGDNLRVIVCPNRLQYILQRRYSDGLRGVTWRAFGYFVTRESLIRFCEGLEALSVDLPTARLSLLPQRPRDWAN